MSAAWEVTPLWAAGRPEIFIGPDEARVIDEACGALMRATELYVRGNTIVEVITDDPRTRGIVRGGPIARIAICTEPRVREILAREATWVARNDAGKSWHAHPAPWAVHGVMARASWPGLRPIVAVSAAPTMRPDGTLLSRAGYDDVTGIYLAPSVEVTVPDCPTQDDARDALAMLSDVLCDFPARGAAKSAWLSGVITMAVRPAIEGPAPMILVDAPVRGSGKSLSVDAAAVIATGRPAARMIYSRDDAEVRKVITASALIGDPVVLLDNVTGELGCPSLDAALTADTWRDRVLGSSTMTNDLPLRISWWATGNGMIIGADLVRRALLMRLEPDVEHPEERSGWRYPRLLEHVLQHRAELLSAALTIPRAYVAAGRPKLDLRPMGSYERWSDLVRSSLVWAGAPDPCLTIADLRAADARGDALKAAVSAWPVSARDALTAAELIDRATPGSPWRGALVEWVPPRGAELPTARALGYALRSIRGRIVGGQTVVAETDRTNTMRWRLSGAWDAGNDGDGQAISTRDPQGGLYEIEQRSHASHSSPALEPR